MNEGFIDRERYIKTYAEYMKITEVLEKAKIKA